jgi:MFS family permease
LLARLFFSIGGAATTTMVTAILPSMTVVESSETEYDTNNGSAHVDSHLESPSASSELTITPSRLARPPSNPKTVDNAGSSRGSPTRLAGIVGMFTGCGALVALVLFLPLPTQFQKLGVSPAQALIDTYYLVGAIAILVAVLCFLGLRRLKGEDHKTWRSIFGSKKVLESDGHPSRNPILPYHELLLSSLGLGFKDRLIGLGYLGGFVARASSVGISLFIPLYVNSYFITSGKCKIDDPEQAKAQCREAYILAAKLTGVSQLVALIFAPIFGYLADRYKRYHIPLLTASISGIVGYLCFAKLKSPETHGQSGSPMIYFVVALLGISQIGCIVCSLGLLGRGISGLEDTSTAVPSKAQQQSSYPRDSIEETDDVNNADSRDSDLITGHVDGVHEATGLLSTKGSEHPSQIHLKGSVAGVYSLAGGAGILLLTKLGGFLFDVKSPAAPFYMLSLFNLLLLSVGVACNSIDIVHARQRS